METKANFQSCPMLSPPNPSRPEMFGVKYEARAGSLPDYCRIITALLYYSGSSTFTTALLVQLYIARSSKVS